MELPNLARLYRDAKDCAHVDGDPDVTLNRDECANIVRELDILHKRYRLLHQMLLATQGPVLEKLEAVAGDMYLKPAGH